MAVATEERIEQREEQSRRFGCGQVGRTRALGLTLCLDAPQDTA